jgi:hypothetical protein
MQMAEPVPCSLTALILAAISAAAIGLIFSLLPYALWFHSTGSVAYVADKDNQYYLQLASQAYFGGGFSLSDVTVPAAATIYQGAQFVPAVALDRVLGLPVLDVNLIWRIWAGIAVPLMLFCLFFRWLRSPWASAFCAILMLADCGITLAQPGFLQALRTYQAAVGHLPTLYDGQDLLNQWRVIDPAGIVAHTPRFSASLCLSAVLRSLRNYWLNRNLIRMPCAVLAFMRRFLDSVFSCCLKSPSDCSF